MTTLRIPDGKARTELPAGTCSVCSKNFIKRSTLHVICSPACLDKAKPFSRKAIKEEKRADRKKREAMRPRKEFLKEAKEAIQKFRRLEELAKGSGCMSCGRSQQEVTAGDWRPGGYWDGGHFLGKGARPELALEPRNIWLQCKSCNAGSGKYARKGYTVNANFETNLIEHVGIEEVEWLKGPHEPKKYTVDDLRAIRDEYRARARELEKQQENT